MRTPISLYAWIAALVLHLALAGGLWLWAGLLPGLLIILPLVAGLPGLLRKKRYTAGWMTLLLSGYCAALLAEAYAMASRHDIAIALSTVAALEFVALTLFVRWAAREATMAA